ncbi:MAG: small multi-drug export protein [Planctomycetota bacterium]|jgi:uncharacterized membrane protein
MVGSPEGHVLILGIAVALLYILWLAFELFTNPDDFHTLLGMTAAEVVFGRIVCMGIGYSMEIGHVRVILISMLLETILVLVFYPLFVFIWKQLLVTRWLKRLSDRTYKAAERHKDKVRKYGVIGLFAFVWLPFWMTGPVVGCMIGYLLGMRIPAERTASANPVLQFLRYRHHRRHRRRGHPDMDPTPTLPKTLSKGITA